MNLPQRPEGVPVDLDRMETGNTRRNAFWFACNVDGGRVNFAACRTRTAIIGTSQNPDYGSWPQCAKAMRSGDCLCDRMVAEEVKENRAIWFVQREGYDPVADAMRPPQEPAWATRTTKQKQVTNGNWRSQLRTEQPAAAQKAPKAAPRPAPVASTGNDYADAINNYMAQTVAEKQREVKPTEVTQNQVTSGEVKPVAKPQVAAPVGAKSSSPLERARAMLASRNQ